MSMHRRRRQKLSWKAHLSDDENDDASHIDDTCHVKAIGAKIFFHSDVSKKSVFKMIGELATATEYSRKHNIDHVELFIHSDGGDLFAGLSAMDHISKNEVPIWTYCDGFVASAATLMLLGGAKRMASRHSFILIHQLSTEFWGKYADLVDEMNNAQKLMDALQTVYRSKANIPDAVFVELFTKEIHMSSEQAHQYGVVQAVL